MSQLAVHEVVQGRQAARAAAPRASSATCCRRPVRLANIPQRSQKPRPVVVASHPPHVSAASVKAEPKGFVDEMRKVAMKLHTKDQAPKEGGKEASPNPMAAWQPTHSSYLRFLVESKVVYDALEEIVNTNPEYAAFRNTGLERSAALAADIEWFKNDLGITVELPADSPGAEYAAKLKELSVNDPPAFICHYYNFYFAHTAGGRMIGNKVAGMILNDRQLQFYKWDGDMRAMLDAVRAKINVLAEGWDREQKDHCLQETESSFKFSGQLLRLIFQPSS